jgi:hypothetical protein
MEDVLNRTEEKTDGENVSVREILDAFDKRSYGPILLLISLIALIPLIGGIPGMSILTGSLIILIATQLLFLKPHPWLPKKIQNFSFKREKLTKSVEKARPWAQWVGRFVRPRWTFFMNPPFINNRPLHYQTEAA